MAEISGLSIAIHSAIENGDRIPRIKIWPRLAQSYEMPVFDFGQSLVSVYGNAGQLKKS